MKKTNVAIIGAGPAGLTAGYLLAKKGIGAAIIESDPTYVGGISRTVRYKGYHFDIGGHRFFSKAKAVEDLWTEILDEDFLVRPRSSRIFYGGKFFSYPLKPAEALLKLGPVKCCLCMLSYMKAKLFPIPNPTNFEDWVTNQFGKRLFSIFFKSYTEKVWGMDCKDISADWAAQRIKGLSLGAAILNAFKRSGNNVKSLITSFKYPRKGPGQMWETCAEKFRARGGTIEMGATMTACKWDGNSKLWELTYRTADGGTDTIQANHLISSAPIRHLISAVSPAVSEAARNAADSLKYRDFLIVALILKDRRAFDDNWIYIHDPSVKVGRIQNFKSWSPDMVPTDDMCCYGMEYFCFENDGLWSAPDSELIERAKKELEQIGLAKATDVQDGCVVRQKKAYPVYDDQYAQHVATIRDEIEQKFPTLHLVGRNGMHKYNNQDHAMMTAMLCVENIVAGQPLFNLWEVNQDAEYHEAGSAGDQASVSGTRQVPSRAETTRRG